jgi:hypothetical protein
MNELAQYKIKNDARALYLSLRTMVAHARAQRTDAAAAATMHSQKTSQLR